MSSQVLADRFEIKQQLSRTDFSTVYLASDRHNPHRSLCRITAISYSQLEISRRLEQEARMLERLGHHPQVPELLAYFHPRQPKKQLTESSLKVFYLVQDQIVGHPLSEEIALSKPLSESYVIKLLQDLLTALAFVHQQNAVHQNLHPRYLIRRASDGQVFLTQFGAMSQLAKGAIAANNIQNSPILVAPQPYAAPEQMQSSSPRPASDLYALGLIAIEALTGQRHQDFTYDPGSDRLLWRQQTEVSLPLAEFIDRLVRHRWQDRFANAHEALITLEVESNRHQIAHDSRLPTVIAAPGQHRRPTQPAPPNSPFSPSSFSHSPSPFPPSSQSQPTKLPIRSILKFTTRSLAVLLAIGMSVKAYQWSEYRLSQLSQTWPQTWPQTWQTWKDSHISLPKPADFFKTDSVKADAPEAAATPQDLTPLLADGSILLRPDAAEAFWQMVVAAREADIDLYPLAGYAASSDATPSADYASGYALDIGGADSTTDQQASFAQTDAFRWLQQNAQDYGFAQSSPKKGLFGIGSEPWHWRYVGNSQS
ncbi:MAG: D-alanyl-D-alanine carboxypeptidase family protein [Phormidesmis sp.]